MNMKKMEELGIDSYYLDLKKYSIEFLDKNYPLTKGAMSSLLDDTPSFEAYQRQEIYNVMKQEVKRILELQIQKNKEYKNALLEGKQVDKESIEQYQENLFNYKQQILEKVYDYKQNNLRFNSKTVYENATALEQAVKEGLESETVEKTLSELIEKAEENKSIPKQFEETVETIVEMKSDTPSKIDESYSSDLVKNNSEKIKEALTEGIEPDEVANTLVNSTNNANDKKSKKHLNFVVKLVSKMKTKELNLKKKKENQVEKGRQKVKTNN